MVGGECPCTNDKQATLTLRAFSGVIVTDIASESITNPSKTSLWEGMNTDFSG